MENKPKLSLKNKWNNLNKKLKIFLCIFIGVSISAAISVPIIIHNLNKQSKIETTINIESSTLSIKKNEAQPKDYYSYTIYIKDSNPKKVLPDNIEVSLNDSILSQDKYSYSPSDGLFKISNTYQGKIIIKGEAKDISDKGFKVTFDCENCSVYVYEDQDYSKTPTKKDFTYSYNVDEKKFSKDGKGQVNFRVSLPENYEINYIWPKGIYKNLKQINDTHASDIYRLTQICGDITIKVSAVKRYVKEFSCIGDYNNKTITLNWNIRDIENVTNTKIYYSHGKESIEVTLQGNVRTYTIKNVNLDELYNITISPISSKGEIEPLKTSKMLSNIGHEVNFPRLELTTDKGLYPTINKGGIEKWDILSLGFHEGRDPFVNSLVELYDGETKIFTSSNEGKIDQAKIKVRGNGSVSHFNEKMPLKLKLSNAADILNGLRKHPKEDVNYANKDWVLLPYSKDMGELIGFTCESTFDFEYAHEYAYITLYINNDYQGLYSLVEANNKGLGEANSQSRYKVDEGGFLIENDYYYYKEDVSFPSVISSDKYQNVFTYPDLEDKKINYQTYVSEVKSFFDEMETAIKNNDPDLFDKYLDIESFAKWLVDFDFIQQGDFDGANRFLVKHNKSGKVCMGTPWDYEYLMGTYPSSPEPYLREEKEFYYYYIYQREDFKSEVRKCFDKYKNNVLSNINSEISKLNKNYFNKLINYEEKRNNLNYKNYDECKTLIDNFFTNRVDELEELYK